MDCQFYFSPLQMDMCPYNMNASTNYVVHRIDIWLFGLTFTLNF